MLGYTVEEMASISLLEVLDDEGRDQGAAFLARQREAGGTTESAECLLLRRDGEPVWTVISHSPWQDQSGRYLGLIAFVNDITERRRLSDELRRREEQLAEAQRVAHLGSWEWNIAADELQWSDELYRIFQLAPGEFDGTFEGYLALVHPDDREMTAAIVSACLEGLPGFEFDQRIGGGPGQKVVWVRASGEVLRDDTGRPLRMRGTALNITAYKEAESELEAARDTALAALRAKSAFLATMSHEIRTPMNGVIGLADLLITTDLDERQRQYVAGVQTAGEALLAIINDVLDFSKIEAGRMELEVIDLDVTAVVEEVAGLLARQAHAKGIELITRCPGMSTTAARRPVAAPAGAAEPHRQRDQVHRRRRGRPVRAPGGGRRMTPSTSRSRSPTPGSASRPPTNSTSSSRSPRSMPRPPGVSGVRGWVWRSPGSWSRRWGAISRSPAGSAPAACSASRCAFPEVGSGPPHHRGLWRRCRRAWRCSWSTTTRRTG